jgi:predicted acyltransferase
MSEVGSTKSGARLLSLDTLRGLTIFLMLLVNNFGVEETTPRFLIHAAWQGGMSLADMVFPWFLLCAGIAIPFSAASYRAKNRPIWRYDIKVLVRVVCLYGLGMLVGFSETGKVSFNLGVLQLIGLAFGIGAFLYELPIHRRLFAAGALLLSYYVFLKFVPIFDQGPGVLRQSHNIVHHINVRYLAAIQMEGLPLVVPTSVLVLIGTWIGDRLREPETVPSAACNRNNPKSETTESTAASAACNRSNSKVVFLLALGGGLVAAGFVWSLSIGIYKPVWTPSFVLISCGAGTALLGGLYYLVDVMGFKRWTFPLVVFGSNAIFAYVVPILAKEWALKALHISTGGWARSLAYIAVWWVVLWVLYRKKLFLRV